MYDEILLPTDGSAGMDTVIEHAMSLAREHGATIHAVYVINTANLSDIPLESSWEGVSNALEAEGRTALNEVERRIGDEVPLETTLIEGSPATEVVNYGTEHNCDLIVMGTHGRSGVDRLLLGSVAERIVRTSPIPVLTIRVNSSEE